MRFVIKFTPVVARAESDDQPSRSERYSVCLLTANFSLFEIAAAEFHLESYCADISLLIAEARR